MSFWAAVVLLSAAVTPSAAWADALPPPQPMRCPSGSHVVHGHGGTGCVQDAPKSCPTGWIGREGGTCIPHLCNDDAACGGTTCKPVDLCAFDDPELVASREDRQVRSPLLAAPPMPRKARLFSGPCGGGGACSAGEVCRRAGVCLPASVAAPAPRPANGAPAVTFGDASGEIPDFRPGDRGSVEGRVVGEPPASAPASNAQEASSRPGKSGGCAGCRATPSGAPAGATALLAGVLALLVRRRQRR